MEKSSKRRDGERGSDDPLKADVHYLRIKLALDES